MESLYDMVRVVAGPKDRQYVATSKPAKMGSNAPIAFGGCVMSQCVSAGFMSLPPQSAGPDYELYSVSGIFLGPGSVLVEIEFSVEHIRDTRTFATRKVDAWQTVPSKQDPSKQERRRVMVVLMDFQVREPREAFDFARLPIHADPLPSPNRGEKRDPAAFRNAIKKHYGWPDSLLDSEEYWRRRNTPQQIIRTYKGIFPLFGRYFDVKPVTESMAHQLLFGVDRHQKSTQDNLPIDQRTSSIWFKRRKEHDLSARGAHEAATAFYMDGALAFLSLTFTHQFLASVAATSSLEFSLRFLSKPNIDDYVLQEQSVEVGSNGRGFGIGRLWDQQGRLIAHMSQVSILRPWPSEEIQKKAEASAERAWAKL